MKKQNIPLGLKIAVPAAAALIGGCATLGHKPIPEQWKADQQRKEWHDFGAPIDNFISDALNDVA